MKQQPFTISGIDDYGKTRVMLYQSGREGTVPASALRDGLQPLDATLTALAALNSTPGFVVQTAADTFTKRSLVQPAAGITITNPAGTAGDATFALANDLSAVEGLATTGLAYRSATDTWSTVTRQVGQTFTPTIVGATTAGAGTYSVQTGFYTRVDQTVTFTLTLVWSAHTGTGLMRIGMGTLPTPIAQNIIFPAGTANMTGSTSPAVQWNSAVFNIVNAESLAGITMDTAATIIVSGSFEAA